MGPSILLTHQGLIILLLHHIILLLVKSMIQLCVALMITFFSVGFVLGVIHVEVADLAIHLELPDDLKGLVLHVLFALSNDLIKRVLQLMTLIVFQIIIWCLIDSGELNLLPLVKTLRVISVPMRFSFSFWIRWTTVKGRRLGMGILTIHVEVP